MTRFATRRPITFALSITVLLLAAYVGAGVVAALSASDVAGRRAVEAVCRFIAALLFLWMLRRLDWQDGAGIAAPGTGRIWLLVLLVLAYRIAVHLLVLFGDLGFALPEPVLAGAVGLNGAAAGLLEEIVFRGVVLYGVLLAWRGRAQGLTRVVLLTSLIFGAAHLIRIVFGQPLPEVSLLALDAFLVGIFLAALVLYAGSVWPAVAIQMAVNAVVGARAVAVPGFQETVGEWLVILVLELPLVAVGLFLLREASHLPRSTPDESPPHVQA